MKKLLLLSLFAGLFSCRIEVYLPPPSTPAPPAQSTPTPVPPVQTPSTQLPQNQRPQSKFQSTTGDVLDRYIVTAYIVAGDTLFSTIPTPGGYRPGINKVDIDNFAIVFEETGKDQYVVTASYYHNPTGQQPKFTKEVTGRILSDYYFQFIPAKGEVPTSYEWKMQRFTRRYYERTVGGGIRIPLAGSSGPLDQTTDKEVIIVAMPQ